MQRQSLDSNGIGHRREVGGHGRVARVGDLHVTSDCDRLADAEFNNFGQAVMKLKRSASAANVSINCMCVHSLMLHLI